MPTCTAAMCCCPAHDPNDNEVGQRHNLPVVRVFTYDGHMTGAEDAAKDADGQAIDCGKYAGMTTLEARKAIVADLQELGLLKSIEPLTHEVGTCYRCHTVIEPMVSRQWFVKMKPLAEPAIACVKSGETKFVPERFTKQYMNWMENIRDWCISRQLWWGHRIPVWYCDDCGAMTVSREDPTCCCKCGSAHIKQDEDVLDTWFSSALWPFSTLGWPDNTEDLKYFYPTNLLVTGYDIITFWVSRMITMGLEEMQVPPFQTVLIHGLVRDELGRKMSKSLGNGVDPLEVIDQYGADALRFSLVMGVSAGNDTRYIPARVESARNFANKVWNASRFVLMNVTEKAPLDTAHLTAADQWILSRFQDATRAISSNMEEGEFGLAADRIYDFAWSEFCDWYIELAKSRLNGDDPAAKKAVQGVLLYVLEGLLKLLHPFMPFLTEQVYKFLPGSEGFLMLKSWPEVKPELDFPDEEAKMEGIIRTFSNAVYAKLEEKILQDMASVDAAFGTKTEMFKRVFYPCVENDPAEVERVRALLGDRFVTEKPRMIAEDFAYYQLNVPGVFVFCGCMDEEHRSPLHADTFDFDERALITGLALFIGLTARKDKENGLV